MAEQAKKTEAKAPKKPANKKRFFRNRQFSGLQVRTGESDIDVIGPRFVPYYEIYQGDRTKVGYFATEDAKDAEAIAGSRGTEEIEEKEYKEATEGKNAWKAPQPL